MTMDESSGERSESASPFANDDVAIDLATADYTIYECLDCETVVFTVDTSSGPLQCHGRDMEPVTDVDIEVTPPDLRQVLQDAFGLPRAGLDICLCVIDQGPLSPQEVADELGYDRTTVSRYLNSLVDIGLLEKAELNREGGGVVNVYHSIDLEKMRRETLIGFYAWAGKAASMIDEANLTKQEYMEGDPDEGLNDVFWDEFKDTD